MAERQELMACPFCGGPATYQCRPNPNGPKYPDLHEAGCENISCPVGCETMSNDRSATIADWNTRAPHPLTGAQGRVTSPEPAEWEDPHVQMVYRLLCNNIEPPEGEHWEGFVARRIVAALRAPEADKAEVAGWEYRYRLNDNSGMSGWERCPLGLYNGIVEEMSRGLRIGYEVRCLYAHPPVSDAGIAAPPADVVEFKSKAAIKSEDLEKVWGVDTYFSHPIDAAAPPAAGAEAVRFIGMVRALLHHTNPFMVNEGHAQQWMAVNDECDKLGAALAAPVAGADARMRERALAEIERLRVLAATDFDSANCRGQRGQDRCDALYDAYQAVKALPLPSTERGAATSWADCIHDWAEVDFDLGGARTAVKCKKCQCPGERDDNTSEIYWPAT